MFFTPSRLIAATVAVTMTATTFVLPAFASEAPAYETKIAVVSTAGLDLGTQLGAALLNARVHAAVSILCGAPDMDDTRELNAVRHCRAGAIAATQPQVQAAIEMAERSSQGVAPLVQVSSAAR